MARITRRAFGKLFGMGVGSAVLSTGVTACQGAGDATFEHGVASGDPLTDRVILWTRVTPAEGREGEAFVVAWQVATDADFTNVVVQDEGTTSADRDFTIKVDAAGLQAATTYYYRFTLGDLGSPVGVTRTLTEAGVEQVKLVVVSCSNYPAGYFHVYREAAAVDADVLLHLGDYIYEYTRGGYASADAEALGRLVEPPGECIELADYRTRYALYHTDLDLQEAHAALPWITIWDDHEVANDAWREGAENHQPDEGDFGARMMAALQAYAEWMPIRPPVDEDPASLQRTFRFGDLVNLIMLDTRLIGRDQQLDFADYVLPNDRVSAAAFEAALYDPTRTLLGADQRDWLLDQLATDDATWQVLGQQVLMGIMTLPSAVLPRDLSDPGSAPLTFDEFVLLATLYNISQRLNGGKVTDEERALYDANRNFLSNNLTWLLEPNVPYNLDAWDGYGFERETILQQVVDDGVNLVVLAGDTHNAWANNLELLDGTPAGVEFGTSSVSSPGLETFLGLSTAADPTAAATAFENALPQLVTRLQYSNLLQRGYLTVTFTATDVTADYTFVDSVKAAAYSVVTARGRTITVAVGAAAIS